MGVYALADLHGDIELWNIVKQILKPKDTLIFLGDAIDRGEYGIQIMQELFKRPNTIYLKGNHEDMMYTDIIQQKIYHREYPSDLWYINGGAPTFFNFYNLSKKIREELLDKISKLPLSYNYINKNGINILCCHSGNPQDIWDRKHFFTNQNIEKNTIIIHGHTPISYMYKYIKCENESGYPFWYNNHQKCCIDCGCYSTNECLLLNLDTFEANLIKK